MANFVLYFLPIRKVDPLDRMYIEGCDGTLRGAPQATIM
jgi:hypothetical protein